jgi:type II secretory pathway pseudopilin PulG
MVTAKLYFAIGLGILAALAGLTATTFYYRAQATSARAELAAAQAQLGQAQAANKAASEALDKALALKAADEARAVQLQATLRALAEDADKAKASVSDLAKVSSDVRAYLDIRIPDDLRRVLNPGADRKP